MPRMQSLLTVFISRTLQPWRFAFSIIRNPSYLDFVSREWRQIFNRKETVSLSINRFEPFCRWREFSVSNHVAVKLSIPVVCADMAPFDKELGGWDWSAFRITRGARWNCKNYKESQSRAKQIRSWKMLQDKPHLILRKMHHCKCWWILYTT